MKGWSFHFLLLFVVFCYNTPVDGRSFSSRRSPFRRQRRQSSSENVERVSYLQDFHASLVICANCILLDIVWIPVRIIGIWLVVLECRDKVYLLQII